MKFGGGGGMGWNFAFVGHNCVFLYLRMYLIPWNYKYVCPNSLSWKQLYL